MKKDIDNFGLNSRSITDNTIRQLYEDCCNKQESTDLLKPIITEIEERIRSARIMRKQTVLRPSVRTRRSMLYVIIQENKRLLEILKQAIE